MSKNYYIIPIFVPQEGCPHKCVFCNQDRITGLDEQVTKEIVRETIEEYLKTINSTEATVEVSFFGGTFTGIKEEKQKEFLAIAKEYKDKGFINKIRLSTRPDYINAYILDYLKEYSVDIIELGVQSLDEDVLKKAGRGHTVEDVIKASKLIKEYGIVLGHQIMPGLPGDTFDTDIKTVKLSLQMKPDICRIYPSLVIKDTPMETMYKRNIYTPYTLEEAVDISKVMYDMYKSSGVNVIRIGLQPTDSIAEGKDVVSGPFHPAFRELVEGSLIVDKIIENSKNNNEFTIEVNPRDLSKLYANKKLYFSKLSAINKKVTVKQSDEILRGNIKLLLDKKKIDIIF
ncbi:MAG: radical SAM protein [Clostridium butyricum]|nr:radical SAM protein [Clostridium butyricum]